MEKNFKRTTVTSALPYANGPVHIGHLAGVYVPADIYVRYLRLKKEDVLFIGGSDEHGVPITIRAKKEGITPVPCRPLYHRRMPALPFGRSLRRPMRKVRNFPFTDRPYQSEECHQWQQTGDERNHPLVSPVG